MIGNCCEYAEKAKAKGRPIVGIMCEYTPRELIMAAGGVPVCLCGGSVEMIPPAESHLPGNLCPLIKSTYGYMVAHENPFLEIADLVVAETTCDGKKKMFELMGDAVPMHVLELPQKPDEKTALTQWICELRKLRRTLENRFHTRITDDKLRRAITVMNRERRLRREIAQCMKLDNPPITGRQLLELKSIISGIPDDLKSYAAVARELKGKAGRLKSKVRVLLTGVPIVHGVEWVVDLIEDHGGLVVAMENCSSLKPIIEDVELNHGDPLTALARKYLHLPCSVMTRNQRRFDLIRKLVKEYRPVCVVEVIWRACLTYSVESFYVKNLVQNDLHLPYLQIESDYSQSDSERIVVRLEALFESVRGQQSG